MRNKHMRDGFGGPWKPSGATKRDVMRGRIDRNYTWTDIGGVRRLQVFDSKTYRYIVDGRWRITHGRIVGLQPVEVLG